MTEASSAAIQEVVMAVVAAEAVTKAVDALEGVVEVEAREEPSVVAEERLVGPSAEAALVAAEMAVE